MNQEEKLQECLDEDDKYQNGMDFVIIPKKLFDNDEDKTGAKHIAMVMLLYALAGRSEGDYYLTPPIDVNMIRGFFYKDTKNKKRYNEDVISILEYLEEQGWIETVFDSSGFKQYKLALPKKNNKRHNWVMIDRLRVWDIMKRLNGSNMMYAITVYGTVSSYIYRYDNADPVFTETIDDVAYHSKLSRQTVTKYIRALNEIKVLEFFLVWLKRENKLPVRKMIISDYRDRRSLASFVSDRLGYDYKRFDEGD